MRLRLTSSILVLGLFVAMTPVTAHADGCTGICGTDTANGDVTNPSGFSSYNYVTTTGAPLGGGTLPAVFGAPGVDSTNGSTYTTSAFTTISGELINFDFNYVTSDGSSIPRLRMGRTDEHGRRHRLPHLFGANTTDWEYRSRTYTAPAGSWCVTDTANVANHDRVGRLWGAGLE